MGINGFHSSNSTNFAAVGTTEKFVFPFPWDSLCIVSFLVISGPDVLWYFIAGVVVVATSSRVLGCRLLLVAPTHLVPCVNSGQSEMPHIA